MTTGNDQLSGWTEKKLQSTSQSQTCTRKRRGHWWPAAHLIQHSFLNPGDTITSEKHAQQIKEMNRKPQCLQPALVNRMGPILLQDKSQLHVAQSTLQKLNELGYQVLPLLPYSPDFSPNDNSWQAKCSHNQEEAGKAFKVFAESQSVDFYATGTSKLISHWQKCVDCNGSYFD